MGFFVNDEGDFNVKRVFKFGAVGAIILVGLIVYLTNVYTCMFCICRYNSIRYIKV